MSKAILYCLALILTIFVTINMGNTIEHGMTIYKYKNGDEKAFEERLDGSDDKVPKSKEVVAQKGTNEEVGDALSRNKRSPFKVIHQDGQVEEWCIYGPWHYGWYEYGGQIYKGWWRYCWY